jgi:hypothetical protein
MLSRIMESQQDSFADYKLSSNNTWFKLKLKELFDFSPGNRDWSRWFGAHPETNLVMEEAIYKLAEFGLAAPASGSRAQNDMPQNCTVMGPRLVCLTTALLILSSAGLETYPLSLLSSSSS